MCSVKHCESSREVLGHENKASEQPEGFDFTEFLHLLFEFFCFALIV